MSAQPPLEVGQVFTVGSIAVRIKALRPRLHLKLLGDATLYRALGSIDRTPAPDKGARPYHVATLPALGSWAP